MIIPEYPIIYPNLNFCKWKNGANRGIPINTHPMSNILVNLILKTATTIMRIQKKQLNGWELLILTCGSVYDGIKKAQKRHEMEDEC